MTTVLTRPRRADVKARILAAAALTFLEHGYAETKVSDIAESAGFTKGAVYSNFGSKPELFSAVFAERSASITGIALAESGLLDATPAAQAVASIAASLTQQVTDGSRWPTALAEFRALAVRDEAVREVYAQLRLTQRHQLEDQLRARAGSLGLPTTFDYTVAANLLLTVANSLATEHAAAPAATPPALIEASLAHLVRSLLP
ncbi:MAG: helix-turn-helix domain-containing protein [Propionibacteriaceae bacterium]